MSQNGCNMKAHDEQYGISHAQVSSTIVHRRLARDGKKRNFAFCNRNSGFECSESQDLLVDQDAQKIRIGRRIEACGARTQLRLSMPFLVHPPTYTPAHTPMNAMCPSLMMPAI